MAVAAASDLAASSQQPGLALVTVMGLPGCGKTSLCRMLRRGATDAGRFDCVHLEFDEFVPDSAAAAAAMDDSSAGSAWKQARDRLLRSLDCLLARQLRPGGAIGGRLYFSSVDQSQQSADDDPSTMVQLAEALTNQGAPPTHGRVILLDDNFYYASMRHAVFQLARFYNCGYGTVYMKASTGQLKMINAVRDKPVPDGVIARMSKRLEAPTPERNPWEKFTCVLSECDIGFLDDVGHYSDHSVNGRIHALFRDCLANPFEPIDLEEAARLVDEARETCSLSLLHQADLRLRAIVSDWLATRGDRSDSEKAELGKAAASSKRTLMNALRDGKLKVPAQLNAYSPDMRDSLDKFLNNNIRMPN